MAENPTEKTRRGARNALTSWLKRETSSAGDGLPARIGHYTITGKLGQGGMGTVYAARDERLERTVAIKIMSSLTFDEAARKRFWREARAAASVNHPNVCQLYEIGEDGDQLFIAMEILDGEALAERLRRGALNVAATMPIGLEILAALTALHTRGIIHRDLKPSNVFLTSHGVKLLDFGLARMSDPDLTQSFADLTRSGIALGTPRYMAPEQVAGEPVDGRSDLFAVGAILFEMLSGRPAFVGRNVVEILHATLHEQPPALAGSPAVAAMDRVIRHALAKSPQDRPASAQVMAEELRAVPGLVGDDTPVLARTLTRLVVLPFRILRPDPETDFLAFSLPDAIATSLSRFGSLIVRSSATAARLASEAQAPDLKALASEADVDRVVMGTLLRSGDQLQVTAQLVETPSGTLLTSHTVLSSLGNLFRLQDDIVRRVVEALSLPLAGTAAPSTPDVPQEGRAYELYLRANALARNYDQLPAARGLYQQCLEIDPSFAPAWAQLGRCHWVIGKYIEPSPDTAARAEAAFQRALEFNPRLSLTHKLYANFEADTGHARKGLARLLNEAERHGNDAELFAGLVHVCRYAGLFEQSIAAHREARRLDPTILTSVHQSVLMTGDFDRLLTMERSLSTTGGDEMTRIVALGFVGRREEARRNLMELRQTAKISAFLSWADFILAWLERRPEGILSSVQSLQPFRIMEDPEALFQEAWLLCEIGECERGLPLLRRAVTGGYHAAPTLSGSPAFNALRNDPAFQEILVEAVAGRDQALATFREGGGERLLGQS